VNDALAAIWAVVAAIPRGEALSYGEVARRAGLPRRARLVARALQAAPEHLHLPWHRVVNARGAISLPAGSQDHAEQRRRLEAEGVVFHNGRIAAFRASPATLDEILWRPR